MILQLALLPTIVLLIYIYKKDKLEKESRKMLLVKILCSGLILYWFMFVIAQFIVCVNLVNKASKNDRYFVEENLSDTQECL